MAYKNDKYFTLYRSNFCAQGGVTHAFPAFNASESISKYFANMEIALGGYYAEKLIFKEISGGSETDLEDVRSMAATLVNRKGYIQPYLTLPNSSHAREETQAKREINEHYQKRIWKQAMRSSKRYINTVKTQIVELANLMCEKGFIKLNDVDTVMASH